MSYVSLSNTTTEYIKSIRFPHFVNTRPVITISGIPITPERLISYIGRAAGVAVGAKKIP